MYVKNRERKREREKGMRERMNGSKREKKWRKDEVASKSRRAREANALSGGIFDSKAII